MFKLGQKKVPCAHSTGTGDYLYSANITGIYAGIGNSAVDMA
jgi:hypothetical protein